MNYPMYGNSIGLGMNMGMNSGLNANAANVQSNSFRNVFGIIGMKLIIILNKLKLCQVVCKVSYIFSLQFWTYFIS